MKQSILSTALIKPAVSATFANVESQQQTYVHKRVIKSQRRGGRTRSQSAQVRLETKRHLSALASQVGETELSGKIAHCHSVVSALTCGKHIARIIPNSTCEFRLCPDCARRRSRKLLRKHLPTMQAFPKTNRSTPVHLVLTQSHRKETRKQSVKRLRAAFTKLQRRSFWKEHFKGGIWAIETKKGRDKLHHTHFHIIGFRSKFFDIALLRSEWLEVTGDSCNLRLDVVQDLSKGLLEVIKYVSKPLDVRSFDAADFKDFLGLKKMQLFGTFGEYRKFSQKYESSDNEVIASEIEGLSRDLEEGCACPQCNEPLFDVRLSAELFIDFLKRIESSGNPNSPPG
jgi:diadenosine tetraphosphate (Ap4A) HIT family hydrolase